MFGVQSDCDQKSGTYLQLYGVGCVVKDHSDNERGDLLPPLHGLPFFISSKGSFIYTITQTG